MRLTGDPLRTWLGHRALHRRAIWLLLAFLLAHHFIALANFAWANRFRDFAHYYFYARNLVEGRQLFDMEAARQEAQGLGVIGVDNLPNYPPSFYLAITPLTVLPYRVASLLWLLLNELLLLAALLWRGAGRVRHNPVRMAALGLLVFAFQPLIETLAIGQVNVFLLAAITLMVRLWAAGSAWSGAVLGLVVLVKPQFALLGLLWLRPAEWRHLGTAAATALALSLGSLAVVGPNAWMSYLAYVRGLPCWISMWALNLSVRALLFRLKGSCVADGFLDPLAGLSTLVGASILAGVGLYLWRNPPTDLPSRFRAAALVLCAILLAAPYSQEHHLTVLLLAFAGLAIDPRRSLGAVERMAWLTAYVLQGAVYSLVRFPRWHLGLPSLLLYGKGLGVILLAVGLLAGSQRGRLGVRSFLPTLLAAAVGARAAHAILKAVLLPSQEAASPVAIGIAMAIGTAALMLVARWVLGQHEPSPVALWFPVLAWGPLIAAIQAGQVLWVGGTAGAIFWAAWWMGRKRNRGGTGSPMWSAPLLGGLAVVGAVSFPLPLALGLLVPFVSWAAAPEPSSTTREDLGWALAFVGAGARMGWFVTDTEPAVMALGPPVRAALLVAAAVLLLGYHLRRASLPKRAGRGNGSGCRMG